VRVRAQISLGQPEMLFRLHIIICEPSFGRQDVDGRMLEKNEFRAQS
jgi:hypothetical protein